MSTAEELARMQTAPGVFEPSHPPQGGLGMVAVPHPRLDAEGRRRPLGETYHAPDTGHRIQVYDAQRHIPVYRISRYSELTTALAALAGSTKPVISLVGGAGDMDPADGKAVYEQLVTSAAEHGGMLTYGATDAGALAQLGQAKQRLTTRHERERERERDAAARAARPGLLSRVADRLRRRKKAANPEPRRAEVRDLDPPLIGFAAVGTIAFPGEHYDPWAKAPIQPDQDGLVLLPGTQWGAESRALAEATRQMAGTRGSVTVLINGGGITVQDALNRLASTRPDQHLLVYKGSGRAADDIANAREAREQHRRPDSHLSDDILRIADDKRVRIFSTARELAGLIDNAFAAARASARDQTTPQLEVPNLNALRVPEAALHGTPAGARLWGQMAVEGSLVERADGLVTTMPDGDGPEVRAWMRASKIDRKNALARLRHDAKHPPTAERAFRDAARLAYFSALDAIMDRPATRAALEQHTEPLTPTAGPEPPRVVRGSSATRGFAPSAPPKSRPHDHEYSDHDTLPTAHEQSRASTRERGFGREPGDPGAGRGR